MFNRVHQSFPVLLPVRVLGSYREFSLSTYIFLRVDDRKDYHCGVRHGEAEAEDQSDVLSLNIYLIRAREHVCR